MAEDIEAVIKIVFKRRSGALRHCHRTHRVAVDWLFEVFKTTGIQIRYVRTIRQLADIYSKAIQKPETWKLLLNLNQIRNSKTLQSNDTSIGDVHSDDTNTENEIQENKKKKMEIQTKQIL